MPHALPRCFTTATLATALLAAPALAQVSPVLNIKPWEEHPHWADTFDQPMLQLGGHDKTTGADMTIFHYESMGRIKFDQDDTDPRMSLGYHVVAIDTGGKHPVLPDGFTDLALVGNLKLGEWKDWTFHAIGGAGFATDNHFGDTNGLYGIGNLHASHDLNDKQTLFVGINYDGNRSFLPDFPLPYIGFSHRVSDTFGYTVGVPASNIWWRPVEPVLLELNYVVIYNITGRASYFFTPKLSVFAEYDRSLDAFHRNGTDHQRWFYESNRVAGGVRYIFNKSFDVRGGVGFAFEQEFSTGFDVRDDVSVAKPSDELFFFFTLRGTF